MRHVHIKTRQTTQRLLTTNTRESMSCCRRYVPIEVPLCSNLIRKYWFSICKGYLRTRVNKQLLLWCVIKGRRWCVWRVCGDVTTRHSHRYSRNAKINICFRCLQRSLLMLSMPRTLQIPPSPNSKYKYFCCSLHYVPGADRVYRFSSELILFKLCLDGVTSLTCGTCTLVLVPN